MNETKGVPNMFGNIFGGFLQQLGNFIKNADDGEILVVFWKLFK